MIYLIVYGQGCSTGNCPFVPPFCGMHALTAMLLFGSDCVAIRRNMKTVGAVGVLIHLWLWFDGHLRCAGNDGEEGFKAGRNRTQAFGKTEC